MSKELTEQWRNGTLEEDFYYVKNKSCLGVEIDYYNVLHSGIKYWSGCEDEDVEEVLAHVPTYEEWVKNGTWYTEKSHNEQLKKIEKLEQQLKEAEEVILLYFKNTQNATHQSLGMNDGYYKKAFMYTVAKEYLEKYGVEK